MMPRIRDHQDFQKRGTNASSLYNLSQPTFPSHFALRTPPPNAPLPCNPAANLP